MTVWRHPLPGRATLLASVLLAVAAGHAQSPAAQHAPAAPTVPQEQWQPLFNGRNLDGWYVVLGEGRSDDPDRLVQIEDGALHLYKDAAADSKQPFGYLSTVREYSDYDLRLEYRWGAKRFAPRTQAPRDSGILYHVVGEDRVWPRSVECQIWEGDVGDTYAVYTRVTAPVDPATKEHPVYLPRAAGGVLHAVGSATDIGRVGRSVMSEHDGWNSVEVAVRNGTATHVVNGRTVNEVADMEAPAGEAWAPLRRGRIALQLEGAEVLFRKIEIRIPPAGR